MIDIEEVQKLVMRYRSEDLSMDECRDLGQRVYDILTGKKEGRADLADAAPSGQAEAIKLAGEALEFVRQFMPDKLSLPTTVRTAYHEGHDKIDAALRALSKQPGQEGEHP